MMKLDEKALAALRIVSEVLATGRHRFVLIGATVPQIRIDLEDNAGPKNRPTRDIDATVEVSDWPDFERIVRTLREKGFQPGRAPHQFTFADEVRLDLLPYGAGIVQNNQLTWPDTQQIMSVVGFEETFQNASTVEIAPGLSVPVATIPTLVLLKIAAYTDRPWERARDLVDIVFCFEHYATEQERRFEFAGELVDGRALTYEESGAYLLGKDLAQVANRESLPRVEQFVARFDSEYSEPLGQILREEKRLENAQRRTFLFRLFRVFRRGVTIN